MAILLLNKVPRFLLRFSLSAFLCCISACKESRSGLNPGDNPPAVELLGLDQKTHSISDYKGKVVLLNFWATWCGPCVEELPALQSLYNKLKPQGFEILAIGVDDEESSLREFQKKYSLTFPILIDKSGMAKNKFKMTGVPESFLLDRDGKFVMIPDLSDNMPVVRIVGPRNWSAPNALSRISDLLK